MTFRTMPWKEIGRVVEILGILAVVGLAIVGFDRLFISYRDTIKILNQDLAVHNQQIKQLKEEKDQLQKQIDAKQAENQALIEKQKQIQQKYADLKKKYDHPLPKPEQDQFFVSRGYTESYYQPGGGRLFGKDDVVKLQTDLVLKEQYQAENVNLSQIKDKQQNLIGLYQDQLGKDKDIMSQYDQRDIIYKKQIVQKDDELRNQKIKKWLWIIGTAIIAGGGGYEMGHHR